GDGAVGSSRDPWQQGEEAVCLASVNTCASRPDGGGTAVAALGALIRSAPVENNTSGHRGYREAPGHRVPVGPRAFIDDSRWRVLKRLAEVVKTKIALHHGNFRDRSI